jgi:hypothetical protein
MKKAEIIKSKHVDHIENEKKILERIEHPFIVYLIFGVIAFVRCHTTAFCKTIDTSISSQKFFVEEISLHIIAQ